jgi:RHS repeat-associated protein
LTSKVTKVTSPEEIIETVTYDYNLQNRLARVTTSHTEGSDNISDVTEYTYNDEGIRVKSYHYRTINGGARQNEETKVFLIDSFNHTGYAQVLEEWTPGNSTPDVTYTIGDDVISQYKTSTNYLLYDGHGSTRQLADSTGAIVEAFSYDGYGTLLGGNPTRLSSPATQLLYTGEYYDNDMTQYNLRARWYDTLNGRFNQMDSFAGNNHDPQSLHKYLYCHANPVNNIDPSGNFTLGEVFTVQKITAVLIGALAPAIITAYESAKAGLGWGEILRNTAIAYVLAVGFGMLMIAVGPYAIRTITSLLTRIPGVTAGMVKTALSVLFFGLGAYGLIELWTSDYPLSVKMSVTIVITMAFVVAVYKPRQSGGRLGSTSTREQNRQIAQELINRNYEITGGGGMKAEEYLPGTGPGTKGSNYIDITAKHRDTGRIIRINTVSTNADGITPTSDELRAAALIRSKLPPGDHLLLIPKGD